MREIKEERFRTWKEPEFKAKGHNRYESEYGWSVWHLLNLKLGKFVDIGFGTLLFAHEGIEIEDNVQIGAYCKLYSYNSENDTRGKIIIKKGALIGADCIIFPGVIIEENEKIKAKSIVWINHLTGRRLMKCPK